jgi:hypothetical protein
VRNRLIMRNRLIGSIAIAALALAACGGDDEGSGDSPQDEVADMMLDVLDEELRAEGMDGVEIDEACLREAIGGLSDEDAEAIVDAGPDGDPEVSASASAIGESMFACVDIDFSAVDG